MNQTVESESLCILTYFFLSKSSIIFLSKSSYIFLPKSSHRFQEKNVARFRLKKKSYIILTFHWNTFTTCLHTLIL